MINWFKNIFKKDTTTRIKNLEIQCLYLHTRLRDVENLVAKQSEILANMAHVQSEISGIIWAEGTGIAEGVSEDKSIFSQKFIISKDDDFLN